MICACGCRTPVEPDERGRPRRYIHGHNTRRTPHDYEVQDRGYETPCWTWLRDKNAWGYGLAWDRRQRRMRGAAVVYFERAGGFYPYGTELDHLCRNRDCVNPDHLEVVDHSENIRRSNWHGGSEWRKRRSQHGSAASIHFLENGAAVLKPLDKDQDYWQARAEAAERERDQWHATANQLGEEADEAHATLARQREAGRNLIRSRVGGNHYRDRLGETLVGTEQFDALAATLDGEGEEG